MNELPQDLSLPAIKLARRLQALTDKLHIIILWKRGNDWHWSIVASEKIEKAKN